MCISIRPTEFGKTITGIYEAPGGWHVEFYQNTVGRPAPATRRRGAGLLSAEPLGAPGNWADDAPSAVAIPDNWLDDEPRGNALVMPIFGDWDSIELLSGMKSVPNALKDIRTALQPISKSLSFSLGGSRGARSADVVIEQYDVYTIVRASSPKLIPEAVKALPANVRPPINQPQFDALDLWYRINNIAVPFAVCCFAEESAREAKPIAFKYRPLVPGFFSIYTLDEHEGGVPKLDAEVDLDHNVFVGSYRMAENAGNPVHYSDNIPADLRPYLPTQVIGAAFEKGTRLVNGDIVISVEDVVAGRFNAYRALPPGAPKRARTKLLVSEY